MTPEEFVKALENKNIQITDTMLAQFDVYYQMLSEYNKIMDLTNVIEKEQVYERHFYDSLSVAFTGLNFNNQTLCDVGSGAGFPAIPLKIVFPEMELVIIDSLNKRMLFLNEVIKKLNLKKTTIVSKRVEDVTSIYRNRFDFVTARAVARLNILLELCVPIVKVNGQFIAMKGMQGNKELEESKNAIAQLDITLIHTYQENQILNFYFKKMKETNLKYPRRFAQIKQKPL